LYLIHFSFFAFFFSITTAAFGNNNNNNNNNGGSSFYVGPYCAESEYVYLGAFYDEDCTYQADTETFNAQNYGDGFPYFETPIITSSDCVSCLDADDNGGGGGDDQYYQPEATEFCDRSTEEAIKCDKNRGYYSGCTFLQKTMPCLAYGDCDEQGSSEGSGWFDTVSKDSYDTVMTEMMAHRKAAFIMGAFAGALMLGIVAACISCVCTPRSLYQAANSNSRRHPLLRK
jgi:hypothetical protein